MCKAPVGEGAKRTRTLMFLLQQKPYKADLHHHGARAWAIFEAAKIQHALCLTVYVQDELDLEMAENKLTPIADLGEFGLIERLAQLVPVKRNDTIKGIGDDAAIYQQTLPLGLVSTDIMIEGVHFDLSFHPLQHLGYKAIAVNVSDIAAMNAVPRQVVVSLGVPARITVEALEALYEGIAAACEDYSVDLVGGDTTGSPSGLIISVTVLGQAHEHNLTRRDGASPGEVICVTGDLGAPFLGLKLLQREKETFKLDPSYQPDFQPEHQYLLGRYLKPKARTDIVFELSGLSVVPTAMIDISDGLSSELLHICKASGVGAAIYEVQIPVMNETKLVAQEFGLTATTAALNSGDEYELLFTVTQQDFEKIRHLPDVFAIGITREASEKAIIISAQGTPTPIIAMGWRHF